MRTSFDRIVAWGLGALLTAGTALAQNPAPPRPQPDLFGEQIDVRVINVEVVVTDRQGNRVPDLSAADFRLKVDGKVMPIEYFTEVRGGQAIAPQAGSAAGAVPGLPSLAPGSPVGTSYLVFVDDFFSIAPRRDQALKALKDDISRLGPEDRMAIVAFDGRRLDMLASWSQSQNELQRAVDRAMARPADGAARIAERRSFDVSRNISVNSGFGGRSQFDDQLDIEELGYAQLLSRQVDRVVSAATSTLRGFASPPGRKVMLIYSGGWPYSPADYVVGNPTRGIIRRDVPRGEEFLRPLADTANRLGYTVYPIDVPGLEGSGADASAGSFQNPVTANLREQETEASLIYVAQQTGGKALINAQRDKALETVSGDTRSYYWIGFSPEWKKDDARHQVRVEPVRGGLEVRSREGFLDLSRKSEVSMRVESAMNFGGDPEALRLLVELGKPVKAGRGLVELPVTLAVPTDMLNSVPLNGEYISEMELRVAALDVKGDRSDMPVIPLRLTTKTEPQRGHFAKYQTRLKVRRVEQQLVIAVFDPLSGKLALAQVPWKPE
jgi:VWFA-related protein